MLSHCDILFIRRGYKTLSGWRRGRLGFRLGRREVRPEVPLHQLDAPARASDDVRVDHPSLSRTARELGGVPARPRPGLGALPVEHDEVLDALSGRDLQQVRHGARARHRREACVGGDQGQEGQPEGL